MALKNNSIYSSVYIFACFNAFLTHFKQNFVVYPILSQCCSISTPPENVRKPSFSDVFRGTEIDYRFKLDYLHEIIG